MLKAFVAVLGLLVPLIANAAVVTSVFTPLGGAKWSVELGVTNDSSATPISEFTVYFPEANFANLALTASPPSWDTIVLQPDLGIPAPGLVDGLVLDLADSLEQGDSIGGFKLIFDLLGAATPFDLPFEVYDADFNLLDSGSTTVRLVDPGGGGGTVPEPSSLLLAFLGQVGAVSVSRRSRSRLRIPA
jgi:hypothetical protein